MHIFILLVFRITFLSKVARKRPILAIFLSVSVPLEPWALNHTAAVVSGLPYRE